MPKKKRKIIDVFPKPRDSSSAWSSSQTYLFHKGQGSWRGDGEGEGHHQSQQQLQLQLRLQDLHHHQLHHCHHCQRVIWSLSPAPPITLVYGAITEPETIKILFGWFWTYLLILNIFADFEHICWCWTYLLMLNTFGWCWTHLTDFEHIWLILNTFSYFENICWCWTHLWISDTNWKLQTWKVQAALWSAV